MASSSCIHHKYGEKEFLLHTPVFCEVLKPIYSGFCVGHRLVHGLCDRHVAVVQSCTWGLSFTGQLLLNMKPHFRNKYKQQQQKPR